MEDKGEEQGEKFTLANIFNRSEIRKGDRVTGPAIINEDETTIVLTSTRESIRQSDGCIDMSIVDPGGGKSKYNAKK